MFDRVNQAELELIRYLRRSKDQFVAVLHGVAAGVMVRDLDGVLVFVNDPAARMLGYPSHQALQSAPVERALANVQVMDEERRSVPLDALPWRLSLRDAKEASSVLRFRVRATGEERVAMVRSLPIFDEEGQLQLEVTTLTDITERKQIEEEAQEERQRLRLVLDTSQVGMLVLDASGGVIYANRELYRILGLQSGTLATVEDFVNAAVLLRQDGSPYPQEDRPIWKILRGAERIVAQEIVWQLPDGRRVPTIVNQTPIFSADGKVAGAVIAIQDMSALEEAQNARREFLGVVSHEMKNPLAIIKGIAMTALGTRRGMDPAEYRETLEVIEQEADRLRDLVDNLLDLNRIESGTLSIKPAPVDVRAILEDAMAAYRRGGGSHQINISAGTALPPVRADRQRIVQVLMNLLSNASKFSHLTSPITIEVEPEGTHVTVRVCDKGRGIAASKLPMLFRKFSRLHTADQNAPTGTGLGLAICKGIIEAHGGRIWAESPGEGKGSTFGFTLPVASEAAVRPPPSRHYGQRRTRRDREPDLDPRPRILAVDDEPAILRAIRRSVVPAGLDMIAVTDPVEAVRVVESEDPDLLLLDINMPGLSGLELLERVRQFSDVPTIFLTGSDNEEHWLQALELGAVDYIRKPVSPDHLVRCIEAALRRRAPSR